jgi:hypothetical protein
MPIIALPASTDAAATTFAPRRTRAPGTAGEGLVPPGSLIVISRIPPEALSN